MKKKLVIMSIIVGLGFIALGFQNCGSQAEFNNDGTLSQKALIELTDNDITLLATEDEKREVLLEMDLVMNQDPRIVEEPLEDVMEMGEESGEVQLLKEAQTYLCKKRNGKSKGQNKYMFCKVPNGNYAKSKTLCVAEPSLKAHFKDNSNHTNYMGPCK